MELLNKPHVFVLPLAEGEMPLTSCSGRFTGRVERGNKGIVSRNYEILRWDFPGESEKSMMKMRYDG